MSFSIAKSGEFVVAKYAGTSGRVRVDTMVKGKKRPSKVTNVLYVPDLQCNLFSVRRLEDNGMTVKIANGKVLITKEKQIVCTGERQGRLYALDIFLRTTKNVPDFVFYDDEM